MTLIDLIGDSFSTNEPLPVTFEAHLFLWLTKTTNRPIGRVDFVLGFPDGRTASVGGAVVEDGPSGAPNPLDATIEWLFETYGRYTLDVLVEDQVLVSIPITLQPKPQPVIGTSH